MNAKLNVWYRTAIAVALGAAVPLAVLAANSKTSRSGSETTATTAGAELRLNDQPITREGRPGHSFAPVVKRVIPSVVKITTSATVKLTRGGTQQFDFGDPLFRRFFGEELRPRNLPRQHGQGSGVIVSRNGYILTNNHVVEGADEVKVGLNDGRELNAKVVGRDPKSDIAVIKVEEGNLPAIEIANSDHLEVGDVVLAVGNPFGIGQTVTSGIISATSRAPAIGLQYEDFIQTDAAINPGNSGGALVDAEGRLIGINTAIMSRTGGNQGIGFAIPANLAREVMDGLIKDGKVVRGYMGVRIQDVTPALAKEFKLGDNRGALVGEVTDDSPARKGGIEPGDIVLEVNGKSITSSRQLSLTVARTKPGETVPVKLLRDGDTKTVKVKVAELPNDDGPKLAQNDKDEGTLNGVGVGDLDTETRAQFRIPESIKSGAVVTEVEPDSAAAEAGVQPGDVILEMNRTKVKNSQDAVRLSESPEDKTTLLKLWSKGRTRFAVVDETGR